MRSGIRGLQRTVGSPSGVRAAALLEVLIALAFFVAAAAVVTGALSSSMRSLERQKLLMHGANLASSLVAELQLGIRAPSGESQQKLEPPWDAWTAEYRVSSLETEAGESSGLSRVEVIVRHEASGVSHRLSQSMDFRSQLSSREGGAP